MLSDPYLEAPKNKVFVGWSLEKDGDILESEELTFYVDKDTTLYAKFADEVILTIHDNTKVYTEKVPKGEWMRFSGGKRCEIDGKTYYEGQCFKFTKDTDIYLKEGDTNSNVYVSYKDLTKLTGNGYGWVVVNTFLKSHWFTYYVEENDGKEVNLELDESYIPKGMVFDKWVTEGNITIKDPTSKKTSFIMPKDTFNKLGYKAKINTHTTSYIN